MARGMNVNDKSAPLFWSSWKTGQAWGPMSAALNERSGQAFFSFLSRSRDNVFSLVAIAPAT